MYATLDKDGKTIVTFSLRDGPLPITNSLFVLSARPGAPILRSKHIVKASDIPGISQGTIIRSEGKFYIVEYEKGFYAYDKNKVKYRLSNLKSIEIVSHVYLEKDDCKLKYYRPLIKVKDKIYLISSIYGILDDKLLIKENNDVLIDYDEVHECAHINYNNRKLFFGEDLNGSKVTMYRGDVGIWINGEFRQIKNLVQKEDK